MTDWIDVRSRRRPRCVGSLLLWTTRAGAFLPLALTQRLGAFLGWLADVTPSKRRRVAAANLTACFPGLSPEELRALRRRVMLHSGRLFGEMPAAWFRSRDYWSRRLDTSEFDSRARALMSRGAGLIIALPHLGNWELGNHGLSAVGELTALYRPPRRPALEPLLRAGRERSNVRMVPTDQSGLREVCRTLRNGRAVVVLPDQTPRRHNPGTVLAPFFEMPALTMTLLSRLSRRCGSPVLFGYFERRPAGRFALRCVEADPAISSGNLMEAATALNAGVERCVRRCPDQYQWTYRRFKRSNSRNAPDYAATDPTVPPGRPWEDPATAGIRKGKTTAA